MNLKNEIQKYIALKIAIETLLPKRSSRLILYTDLYGLGVKHTAKASKHEMSESSVAKMRF